MMFPYLNTKTSTIPSKWTLVNLLLFIPKFDESNGGLFLFMMICIFHVFRVLPFVLIL